MESGLTNRRRHLLLAALVMQVAAAAAVSGFGKRSGSVGGSLPSADLTGLKRCQAISIPMCRNIGYNFTAMPNQFGHESQEEAALEVHQFWPLVEIGCSQDLRFFLCSMYAPICMQNYDRHLPACRSVCERAKRGCAPLMRQYGFSWPDRIDCSKLPEFGDPDILCMDVNHTKSADNERSATTTQIGDYVTPPPGGRLPNNQHCDCQCRPPLVSLAENEANFNRVSTVGVPNCALPCHGAYFFGEADSSDQADGGRRQFAAAWTGVWSVVCLVSSSMTLVTFLMDRTRFNYPERPIVMMSACYVMVSIGYIIRLAVGADGIGCDGRLLRYGSSGPWLCSVVFLLTYLFGMASCVWWVALCVAWFLAAGLKWGSEAIAKYGEVFHCLAWLLPVAKFILVLTFSLVDGDPISGICSVGNTNLTAMRIFVLAPLITYLLLGSIFLLTGFVALFRIRSVIKQQACAKTYKLEKLMIRIGIFSILYTLPACVVIACHFYEAQLRETWLRAKACRCGAGRSDQASNRLEPEFGVFMLRQFMQLAVGITSGVWIWSGKTLATWREFFNNRIACCRGQSSRRSNVTNGSHKSVGHNNNNNAVVYNTTSQKGVANNNNAYNYNNVGTQGSGSAAGCSSQLMGAESWQMLQQQQAQHQQQQPFVQQPVFGQFCPTTAPQVGFPLHRQGSSQSAAQLPLPPPPLPASLSSVSQLSHL